MSPVGPVADPVLLAVLAGWAGLALAVGVDAYQTGRPALRWAATVALVGLVGLIAYAGDDTEGGSGSTDDPDDAAARCGSCGTAVPENARYCPDCGAPVEEKPK